MQNKDRGTTDVILEDVATQDAQGSGLLASQPGYVVEIRAELANEVCYIANICSADASR